MEIGTIRILEPKAKRIIDDLESLKLIEIERKPQNSRPKRRFGSMKGLVKHISDDFDAPLEDFEGYM